MSRRGLKPCPCLGQKYPKIDTLLRQQRQLYTPFRINEKSAVVFKAIYEFVGNYYRVKTQ